MPDSTIVFLYDLGKLLGFLCFSFHICEADRIKNVNNTIKRQLSIGLSHFSMTCEERY